jgi:hypothetical protein
MKVHVVLGVLGVAIGVIGHIAGDLIADRLPRNISILGKLGPPVLAIIVLAVALVFAVLDR